MKVYIEKAAIIDLITRRYEQPELCTYEINSIPAADVVPVVRCRECKQWDADPDSYGKDDGPKGKCMKSFEETYDNDFCSYGQRKEATHD